MVNLNKEIQFIKGVGPNRVTLLKKLGIENLGDLISFFPREHEDRSKPKNISELIDGEEALIKAIPASRFHVINVKRNMKICKLLVRDETGTMEIVWYNQQYLKDKFIGGKCYSFYGKVSKKTGTVTMNSPVFDSENESKNTGKIIPIYPLTYKLSQNVLRQIIENGLKMVNGQIEEIIPDKILKEYKLIGVNEATNKIHFPKDFEEFKQARQRLAFEELLTMQLLLNNLKNKTIESHNGIQFDENVKMSDIINSLPFRLTKAQLRVLEEIDKDMESNKIMNRLLQGDVGSGKTIVAIISAYKAVKSGYQMAIMAPTSILATQHLQSFTQILEPFGIKCELLISNMTKKKKEEVIDYKKVINDYGTSAQKAVQNYIKEKNEVPTWQQIGDLIEYKKYEVTCEIHNIYNDGNIYLNSCKVNDKTTKHSFGKEQEEVKEGKKIEVYKKDNKDYYTFSNIKGAGTNLVGTITCKTDNCTYIEAYNKYVIIEEESKYYLYNYETDIMEFGPFDMEDEYSFKNYILSYDNIVYGVLYNENNQTNLYNVSNSKTLKNIKGELVTEEMNFMPSIMYKYNYVILSNRGKNDFVNLKTGNVSYSIKENINTFYEDTKNNIVYITASTNDYSKFKVYNSNGKLLFDGKEFSRIKLTNNDLIVGDDKSYYVYDNKLNLKVSSKIYDEILGIYDDFVVVIDNKYLEIVDINDKVLATFEDEWDSSKYTFNSNKSGKYTDNGKNGIYLIVEDKTIPFGTSGHALKYYYILSTKETGVTKLIGIN